MYKNYRMSQTETKLVTPKPQTKPTDLTDLKTVKWIQNIGVVKQSYEFASCKFKSAKIRLPILAWIIASIEMVVISIFLFIHSLPWPQWMKEIILKLDRIIEHILETVGNKVEWWWDNLIIRLMWFRDSLEALVDAVLSLCLFVVYKIIEIWMWTLAVTLRILKFIFAPLIWIMEAILPPVDKKPNRTTPQTTTTAASAVLDTEPSTSRTMSSAKDPPELENLELFSGTSSESESDVSVVSESRCLGHTDKFGRSYNRVQTKATAEGRLRAAMYKRVKTQLSLMRRNSISFSRGMTCYARQVLEPKVLPILSTLRIWLRELSTKYGLVEVFDSIAKWIESHYLISVLVSFALSVAMIPINILNKVLLGRKKKSRRTRSMRSESFRRRTGAVSSVVTPPVLEPLGLIKSEEPVVIEEPEYSNLRKLHKTSLKGEDDSNRDSALASSIDDLCHTSDSNDGSNSFKDQTIHEEESKEELDQKEVTKTEPEVKTLPSKEENLKDEIPWNEIKTFSTKILARKRESIAEEDLTSIVRQISKSPDVPLESKIKLPRKDVLFSTRIKQEKNKIGAGIPKKDKPCSPHSKKLDNAKDTTYAEVTKHDIENASSKDQSEQSNKDSKPKRKISFSLDH